LKTLIDLETYPLDQPQSAAWRDLVARCRRDLAASGMFNLMGFLRPAGREHALNEIQPKLATEAYTHARRHNIYFKRDIPSLRPDHPALTEFETINHTLCGDQLASTVVNRVYEWPEFAIFLAATMHKPALYTMDDPLARLNTMAYHKGEALNWHFDRSEFTTTLLLQAPDQGGAFEYRTDLRDESDPNYDGVAKLLAGKDDLVRTLILSPGTLNVFRGKNTAHRVAPVIGDKARVISVFSFYDRPGVRFTPEEQIGFYGRAAT